MNSHSMKMPGKGSTIKNGVLITFIVALFWACASQTSTVNIDDGHSRRAEYYYKIKRYDKAKEELLIILKENPDDVETNYRLAVIYGKEGLIDQSRSAFKKVLSIDPEYSKAYYNLGVLYSNEETDNYIKKSIKYFEAFLEMEPEAKQRQEIEKWIAVQIRNLNKYQKNKSNKKN